MRLASGFVIAACASVAGAEPADRKPCDSTLYVAPALMLGAGSIDSAPWYVRTPSAAGAALGRLSVGALIERCDDAKLATMQLRFGLTTHVSTLHVAWTNSGDAGVGAEAELDGPTGHGTWLGGRVAAETASTGTAMFEVGARFHLNEVVWFGVDGYVLVPHHYVDCMDYAVPGCTTHELGIMAGAGLEAHPGGFLRDHKLAIGGTLVVVGGLITAIAIAAQSFHL